MKISNAIEKLRLGASKEKLRKIASVDAGDTDNIPDEIIGDYGAYSQSEIVIITDETLNQGALVNHAKAINPGLSVHARKYLNSFRIETKDVGPANIRSYAG